MPLALPFVASLAARLLIGAAIPPLLKLHYERKDEPCFDATPPLSTEADNAAQTQDRINVAFANEVESLVEEACDEWLRLHQGGKNNKTWQQRFDERNSPVRLLPKCIAAIYGLSKGTCVPYWVQLRAVMALLLLAERQKKREEQTCCDCCGSASSTAEYCHLFDHQQLRGVLAQMHTGEGKTLVVQMTAATLAMQGRRVHIMTSNAYLAQRDYDSTKAFYEQLGVKVRCVARTIGEQKRFCPEDFEASVIIGTPSDFQLYRLFVGLHFYVTGSRRQRQAWPNLDVVLVDEVDALLLDAYRHLCIVGDVANFSSSSIRKEHLRTIHQIGIGCQHDEDLMRQEALSRRELLCLGEDKIDVLVRSCISANLHKHKGADYIVEADTETERKYARIVQKDSTGEVAQASQRWCETLHEFVELKEGLAIEAMTTTLAMSPAPVFVQQYRLILGVTGTLGTPDEQRELETTYAVRTFGVKRHRPSKLNDMGVYAYRGADFDQALLHQVREHYQERSVLVVCTSIQEAITVHSLLEAELPITSKLRCIVGTESQDTISDAFTQAGQQRAVTVTTVLASRGIDIKLDQRSLAKGGLHVVITFLPMSKRVQEQLQGRAARQGELGSSILLVRCPGQGSAKGQWPGSTHEWVDVLEARQARHMMLSSVRRRGQLGYAQRYWALQEQWFAALDQFANGHPRAEDDEAAMSKRVAYMKRKQYDWAAKMEQLKLTLVNAESTKDRDGDDYVSSRGAPVPHQAMLELQAFIAEFHQGYH